jgi:signal transduction histidine kinase
LSERQACDRDGPGQNAAQRIFEAADGARRKLARDLHDGAQQKFVTAMINLQIAQERFFSDPGRAREHLGIALSQSESGLEALRAFVAGVHPPILTHLGLSAAVATLADAAPIPVAVEIGERREPLALEESVYFFISEALTNVIKHSQATEAEITVTATARSLTVTVSDNGVGGAGLDGTGSGLIGLVDRVEALGGDFELSSPAGGGTLVRGVIPQPANGG